MIGHNFGQVDDLSGFGFNREEDLSLVLVAFKTCGVRAIGFKAVINPAGALVQMLASLKGHYGLGLLSNFTHAPAALKIIDRVGIRDYALDWGYRWRFSDRWLRSAYAGFDGYRVEALDTGQVESQVAGLRLTFQNNTQDNFFMRLVANREVLLEDFQIYTASDGSETVVIPPGDYKYNDFRVGTQTGDQRNFALRASISGGEFYDGNRLNTNLELTWRPSEHYRFGINYEKNDIELPYGDFVVNLATLRADFIFSSTLSWVNLIQYDDVTENLGINSRLHWIPRAGREGFIVFNHSLSDADKDGSFQSTSADASVKFSYTFRF